jgi:KR domain
MPGGFHVGGLVCLSDLSEALCTSRAALVGSMSVLQSECSAMVPLSSVQLEWEGSDADSATPSATASPTAGHGLVIQSGVGAWWMAPQLAPLLPRTAPRGPCDNFGHGHILVTGGLRGLGMLAGSWAVQLSSEAEVWLMGRTGRAHGEPAMRASDAFLGCVRSDCGSRDEVQTVVSGMLLRGVLHSGGLLQVRLVSSSMKPIGYS